MIQLSTIIKTVNTISYRTPQNHHNPTFSPCLFAVSVSERSSKCNPTKRVTQRLSQREREREREREMGVIDIITRVDAMCKKYKKYDVDKHKDKDPNVVSGGDDAFASLYGVVEADTDAASQVCLCL